MSILQMFSPLKSSSLNEDEEDLYPPTPSPISRKSDKEIIKNNNNNDIKNPYASRGLDKFSELLADLEKKKKRIYSQKDAEKITSVRFAYSSSNDVIPIVIKSKDNSKKEEKVVSLPEIIKQDHDKPIDRTKSQDNTKNEEKVVSHQQEIKQDHHHKPRRPISLTFEEINKPAEEIKKPGLETEKISLLPYWETYLEKLRQPCYYGPVVIVLILVLLTFVGRSMAILFTSLGLMYIVPIITRPATTEKLRRKKKRGQLRQLDENKTASDGFTKEELEVKMFSDHGLLASPRLKIDSPRHRVHRNNW